MNYELAQLMAANIRTDYQIMSRCYGYVVAVNA
jgi:hypothetical protein